MSVTDELVKIQEENNSMICLGLDLDTKRMPTEYAQNSRTMFEFAYQIIENTKDVVCAYKPNMAFFESMGPEGLSLLRLIIDRVPENIPVILDGKRGDIGNTASHYATALFERYGATWITVNPYMGYDSLRPFLEYKDNGVFILCLTSNNGSKDFQMLEVDGKPLYKIVAEKVAYWNKEGNCGLVVGATQPEQLKDVRTVADQMPILIPGVGAQGGSLELATRNGTANFTRPAVINVSRSVLFASNGEDFAKRAREEIVKLNNSIKSFKNSDSSQIQTTPETKPDRVVVQSQNNDQAQPVTPPVEPYKAPEPTPENKPDNNLTEPDIKKPQEQQQENYNNYNQNRPDYSKPVEPTNPEIEKQTEPIKPTEPDQPVQSDKSDDTEKSDGINNRADELDKKEDETHTEEPKIIEPEKNNSEPEKTEQAPPEPKEKPFVPRPIPKPPSTLPFSNKPGVNPNSNQNHENKKEE